MKKIKLLLLSLLMVFTVFKVDSSAATKEMRAAWISTAFNIDWPSTKNNVAAQKKEYTDLLDKLKDAGMNTVIVQVRPKADAIYESTINPWSEFLTGTQGKYPGYDPLKFMIEETHKRGMEFHAWFNPYRITTTGNDISKLSSDNMAIKHPEWVIETSKYLMFDPGLPEVRQYIVDTINEVVRKYDIDGVQFDDYFYNGTTNEDQATYEKYGNGMTKDDWRRENVNTLLRQVKSSIKSIDSSVRFGVSPIGIWKNKSSDPTGSDTNGNQSYYALYADSRTWIKEGLIDYIAPQLYWEIGWKAADYSKLVAWWSNEVKNTNVDLYIGQGIYKQGTGSYPNENVAAQIKEQVTLNRTYPQIKGSMYFSTRDIVKNAQIHADIKELNKETPVTNTGKWVKENNKWYYYYTDGTMHKGWLNLDGTWYYLKSDGVMATGWLNLNGTWYYLRSSGAMAVGWENVGGTWYYLKSSGAMATGWLNLNGTWYYLRPSGAMSVGWEKIGGTWYYLKSSGAMATGWLDLGGVKYYLRPSGAMAVGWEKINNQWYYFESSGKMATNKVVDGWKIGSNGVAIKI